MEKSSRFQKKKKEMNKKLLVENKEIISEALKFHLIEEISIENNIFRPGSSKYFDLFREVRDLYKMGLYKLNLNEKYFIHETEIGEWDFYNGQLVPLDYPIFEEDNSLTYKSDIILEKKKIKKKHDRTKTFKGRKVKLNKPMRSSGPGKYKVYVKDPKNGYIKQVNFGSREMSVGLNDPDRRKSFAARHKCHLTKDKTKPRYWACRTGRYPYLTGSKKKYTWW